MDFDRFERCQPFEQGVYIRVGQDQIAVFGSNEAILNGPVEQGQQRVVEAADVQYAARLDVEA